MQNRDEDDLLALTLNSKMLPYVNLSFLMSPVDISAAACGGPFGVDTAVMVVNVYVLPRRYVQLQFSRNADWPPIPSRAAGPAKRLIP